MLSFTATLVEPTMPLNTSPLIYKRRVKRVSSRKWIINKIRREALPRPGKRISFHLGVSRHYSSSYEFVFRVRSCTSSFGTLPRRGQIEIKKTSTAGIDTYLGPIPSRSSSLNPPVAILRSSRDNTLNVGSFDGAMVLRYQHVTPRHLHVYPPRYLRDVPVLCIFLPVSGE